MLKHTALFAAAALLGLAVLGVGVPDKPAPMAGSWQVDTRHSDAKLITDATTDYGKTKMNVALGYARITEESTNSTTPIPQNPVSTLGSSRLRQWHPPLMNVANS